MSLEWKADKPAKWDPDKARIVGGAPAGVFDARYARLDEGDLVPGDWWRVVDGDATVGFGWLDVVWGDAEILLAVDPQRKRGGVGSFILDRLAEEARRRGIHYLYNLVRPTHPDQAGVTAFLEGHGFQAGEDGSLFRTLTKR